MKFSVPCFQPGNSTNRTAWRISREFYRRSCVWAKQVQVAYVANHFQDYFVRLMKPLNGEYLLACLGVDELHRAFAVLPELVLKQVHEVVRAYVFFPDIVDKDFLFAFVCELFLQSFAKRLVFWLVCKASSSVVWPGINFPFVCFKKYSVEAAVWGDSPALGAPLDYCLDWRKPFHLSEIAVHQHPPLREFLGKLFINIVVKGRKI